MDKQKSSAAGELFHVSRYQRTIAVQPLFGLRRLVKIRRRDVNGILFCDSLGTVSDAITISPKNKKFSPFLVYGELAGPEVLGETRLSATHDGSAVDVAPVSLQGTGYRVAITPERGTTYSIECDIYSTVDTRNGTLLFSLTNMRIDAYILRLDLSAYLTTGELSGSPMCRLEFVAQNSKRRGANVRSKRYLPAKQRDEGIWEWRASDVVGGIVQSAWAVNDRGHDRAFDSVKFESLSKELGLDAAVAKDLHNFVTICQWYAADVRSLSAIGRIMTVSKSALYCSLDSLERLLGAELIERTKGQGMISITTAGEALLEWWSRFYMRWTPISSDTYVANRTGDRRSGGGRDNPGTG